MTETSSAKLGIGAICRINQKLDDAAGKRSFNFDDRSCYDWELIAGVVCIVDNDRGQTVTNGARNVLVDLIADGVDLSTHPVIYRDTDGDWDRILVQDSLFAGFAPLSERRRDDAIAKLQHTRPFTSAERNWQSQKCEAEELHRAYIEALPEWCEWKNEREAPKDAEVYRSIARAHRRRPDPVAMLCILRNSTQPVNERHRSALLRWARVLYDRAMAHCYAAVTAMVDDTENNYSDPVRSKAVQDDYDDAQCERMDAEDIIYSVVNATILQEENS